jgi:hypothetical protein
VIDGRQNRECRVCASHSARFSRTTRCFGATAAAAGIPRIRQGGFLQAFNDNGVYTETICRIPVSMVLNERLELLGCAVLASR